MECNVVKKNLIPLIKNELKGNALRRTYYHIEECQNCKDALFDEFALYVAMNDLDVRLDFNYKTEFNNFLQKIKDEIKYNDDETKVRYTFFSYVICLLMGLTIFVAMIIVYR